MKVINNFKLLEDIDIALKVYVPYKFLLLIYLYFGICGDS